jgi:hypothetical protein
VSRSNGTGEITLTWMITTRQRKLRRMSRADMLHINKQQEVKGLKGLREHDRTIEGKEIEKNIKQKTGYRYTSDT